MPSLTKQMTKVKILIFLVVTKFRIDRIMADRLQRKIALEKMYVSIVIVMQRLKVILINGESSSQIPPVEDED